MVRLIQCICILTAALCWSYTPGPQPAQTAQEQPKDQMFSGVVTSLAEGSLTAVRAGDRDSKTFAITPETKFEGPKPEVNSRVTIRYVSAPEGDRAVRVIVRSPAKK